MYAGGRQASGASVANVCHAPVSRDWHHMHNSLANFQTLSLKESKMTRLMNHILNNPLKNFD